jgi:hypothetical protein
LPNFTSNLPANGKNKIKYEKYKIVNILLHTTNGAAATWLPKYIKIKKIKKKHQNANL